MDAQRDGLPHWDPALLGEKTLFIKSVTGLVERGEEPAAEIVRFVACAQTTVVRTEGDEERVGGGVEPTTLEIETEGGGRKLTEAMHFEHVGTQGEWPTPKGFVPMDHYLLTIKHWVQTRFACP